MLGVGVPELLIILVIVVIIFGADRISKIGKELGQGVSLFRKAVKDDNLPETTNTVRPAKLDDLDDF